MAAKWIEALTGSLEQKKQYRQAIARTDALPSPYREAAKAINRYFLYSSGITDGETMVKMIVDNADLWEQAAVDGRSVREIVGDDPVEFAESFAAAYAGTHWIDKERSRLTDAIDAADGAPGAGGPVGAGGADVAATEEKDS
ncbi:DUF1048 domain-containing protein [Herbiconiux solani]|uniref:DUF1048 domain-containing protein n=1 Tax=Herbiconiux solani TaxID=661329 RepID=UPI000A022BB5|nr:DUF1048 domain-containing protein [Herbiconiux solani]